MWKCQVCNIFNSGLRRWSLHQAENNSFLFPFSVMVVKTFKLLSLAILFETEESFYSNKTFSCLPVESCEILTITYRIWMNLYRSTVFWEKVLFKGKKMIKQSPYLAFIHWQVTLTVIFAPCSSRLMGLVRLRLLWVLQGLLWSKEYLDRGKKTPCIHTFLT